MTTKRSEAEVIRDAYSPEHRALRAPVQGLGGGIPWSIHLEAYDAYCKRWGKQTALINLKDRGCRGGFGVKELDELIPGWRDHVGELADLRAEVERLRANGAALERDERIIGLLNANTAQVDKRRAATTLLREAAETFRFYERNHRAKVTAGAPETSPDEIQRSADAIRKAERNAEIAGRIETFLQEIHQ